MRFSIMFSVLAASAMVSAKMVVKRSPDDVTNALNTVSSNCDSLISQLNACQSDDCVTQLATQLANILNQCPAKVEAFTCTAATDDTAQAGADLANVSLGKIPRSDTLRSRPFAENRARHRSGQEHMWQQLPWVYR